MSSFSIRFIDPKQESEAILLSVRSFADLVNKLDEIEIQYVDSLDAPIGVNILGSDNEHLDIGLCGNKWILGYCRFDQDEVLVEQKYALGDLAAQGSIAVYYDQLTDMPRKWLISKQAATKALSIWIDKGILDDDLDWSEDGC